jgi:TonB family protein
MMRKAGRAAVMLVILVTTPSFCEDKQARGEAMLERARLASDIRAPDAPAFRLKVTFSFVSEKLETVAGTYSEWWASKTQWRRETVVGDSRRIEIGGPDKRWLLDTGPGLPEQVRRLPGLFDVVPSNPSKFEFDSILDPAPDNAAVQCAISAPAPDKQKRAFCFHKPSGVLIQKVEPYPVGRRVTGYSCDYAAFHMFGNYTYPREMACFIEGHRKIEAKVIELSPEPSLDAALFKAPPEAVELDSCSGKVTPPKAVSSPDPSLPWRAGSDSSVMLELIVDAKGSPQDLKVARSGGKSFDENALRAVRAWRFKPAVCDGRPIATTIQVEVNYRLGQ